LSKDSELSLGHISNNFRLLLVCFNYITAACEELHLFGGPSEIPVRDSMRS